MKDVVTRKKADGDTKVRQLVDLVKVQEQPYMADETVIIAMEEVLKERIAATLAATAKAEPDSKAQDQPPKEDLDKTVSEQD